MSASGAVTAVANGGITVTARHDDRSATANVVVAISGGVGFLRGEAYDDSKGLPLAHATATLVSDGSGPLTPPVDVTADERGRFSIAGRAGDAVVRITKAGFTAVERRASIPANSSTTSSMRGSRQSTRASRSCPPLSEVRRAMSPGARRFRSLPVVWRPINQYR